MTIVLVASPAGNAQKFGFKIRTLSHLISIANFYVPEFGELCFKVKHGRRTGCYKLNVTLKYAPENNLCKKKLCSSITFAAFFYLSILIHSVFIFYYWKKKLKKNKKSNNYFTGTS